MATIKKWWERNGGASANTVKLIRADKVWATGITGVFDSTAAAYYFSMSSTDATVYDPAQIYHIEDGAGNTVVDNLELGALNTETKLVAHEANTATAHGVAGAVVGTTSAQALTQKTMDGDLNTFVDILASTIKTGNAATENTFHPSTVIRPASGSDTIAAFDTADGTTLTLQVANAAKNADRDFHITAGKIQLNNDSGSDILISGVLDPVSAQDAATKTITDALSTRLDGLEVGNTWTGTPTISLSLVTGRARRVVAGAVIIASFDADPVNDARAARFELYWSDRNSFISVGAGATSVAELAFIRSQGNGITIRGDHPHSQTIQVQTQLNAIVVAFDTAGVAYNSAPQEYRVEGGAVDPRRDDAGDVLEWSETLARYNALAGGSSGNTPTALSDWLQSTTAETTKLTGTFRYNANMFKIRATFFLKTSANTGYAKLDIDETIEGSAASVSNKSVVTSTALTSYQALPVDIDIDISSGLVEGELYTANLKIWNSTTSNTNMQTSAVIEVVSNITVG